MAADSTFLFAVESGWFEPQTILAAEAIRQFGGSLKDAEILAVTPRLGPSLAPDTLRRFGQLGVRYSAMRVRSAPL